MKGGGVRLPLNEFPVLCSPSRFPIDSGTEDTCTDLTRSTQESESNLKSLSANQQRRCDLKHGPLSKSNPEVVHTSTQRSTRPTQAQNSDCDNPSLLISRNPSANNEKQQCNSEMYKSKSSKESSASNAPSNLPVLTSNSDRSRMSGTCISDATDKTVTFSNCNNKVEVTTTCHHIETTGPPVFAKSRRLSPEKLQAAKATFDDLLEHGVIRPSKSPWASPLHMVPKPNGEWRQCGDYQALKESVTDWFW